MEMSYYWLLDGNVKTMLEMIQTNKELEDDANGHHEQWRHDMIREGIDKAKKEFEQALINLIDTSRKD
jgi:hypothetical protein